MAEVLQVSADYLIDLTDDPRGHLGDNQLNDDEKTVLNTLRGEGWPGVIRLGVERMTKS